MHCTLKKKCKTKNDKYGRKKYIIYAYCNKKKNGKIVDSNNYSELQVSEYTKGKRKNSI